MAAKTVAHRKQSAPPARPKALRTGERSGERPVTREDDLSGLLAHDLKTPLAAISMNLDFALAELRLGATEGLTSALEDCREANMRAVRIVSDMADAARLAARHYPLSITRVSMTALIQQVVDRISAQAADRRVRVLWATDGDAVRADSDVLAKALERLLERALRHARTGSEVEIEQRGPLVTIRVETMADPAAEASTRSLAMHFAEAAVTALGGEVKAEASGDGALLYRFAFAE